MALFQVVLCRSWAQLQGVAARADAVHPVVEAVEQRALVPKRLPSKQRRYATVREHRRIVSRGLPSLQCQVVTMGVGRLLRSRANSADLKNSFKRRSHWWW